MIKHRRRPHYSNGQNNGGNGNNGQSGNPERAEGLPADVDMLEGGDSGGGGGGDATAVAVAPPPPQQQQPRQQHQNNNNNNNNNQRRRHQQGGGGHQPRSGGGGGGGGGHNNGPAERGNQLQHERQRPDRDGNVGGNFGPGDEPIEDAPQYGPNGELLPPREPKVLHISDLKKKTAAELYETAEAMGLENISRAKKTDIVFNLLRAAARRGDFIQADGVLEIMPDGYGFLRGADASYLAGPDDVYISPSQIRRFGLRTGDTVAGRVRSPKDNERYFALLKVDTINYEAPEVSKKKVNFENLTPLFADERFVMERGNGTTEDITARVIDIVAPFGKGQRGLIVSPPKAGKTILMQNVAQSIAANYPDVYLIVLLIDERPEEVTDMQRTVRGEVISSTFDEPAQRHVQVADMVIEKAKRLVEHKRDVVILLDSITRLARAYNTVAPSSGKVLSGGVDANALQKPKRFFGAARNVEEGGSLTIIATALIDTGSKMDEVIYEEFKGTGNMELHLERRIAEKRVFPAININRSGTRKEELMVDPGELQKVWILRKLLHQMDELAAMELLFDRLRGTKTNSDFFDSMKRN